MRAELPDVTVVVPGTNTGFAGGCNLGIAALAADVELVALVNNDAVPHTGWLAPLVSLRSAPTRGSAPSCRRRGSTVGSTTSRSRRRHVAPGTR